LGGLLIIFYLEIYLIVKDIFCALGI